MIGLNPIIAILTLNSNGLHTPIKSRSQSGLKKVRLNYRHFIRNALLYIKAQIGCK